MKYDQIIRLSQDFGLLLEKYFQKHKLPEGTDLMQANIQVLMEQLPELAWFNCNPRALSNYLGMPFETFTIAEVDNVQLSKVGLWLSNIIWSLKPKYLQRLSTDNLIDLLNITRITQLKAQLLPGAAPGTISMFCCMDKLTQLYLDAPKKPSGAAHIVTVESTFTQIIRRRKLSTEPANICGYFAPVIITQEGAEQIMAQLREVTLYDISGEYSVYFIESLAKEHRSLITNFGILANVPLFNVIIEIFIDETQLLLINVQKAIEKLHSELPNQIFFMAPSIRGHKISLFVLFQRNQENGALFKDMLAEKMHQLIKNMVKITIHRVSGFGTYKTFMSYYWEFVKQSLQKKEAWVFEIHGYSLSALQANSSILSNTIISNSTALNLKEHGPIIAKLGIVSFLKEIVDNLAPEYLDFLASLCIRGTSFYPISATGVIRNYPQNVLMASQVQNARNVFNNAANDHLVSSIETSQDDFVFGNLPRLGCDFSEVVWQMIDDTVFC